MVKSMNLIGFCKFYLLKLCPLPVFNFYFAYDQQPVTRHP